MRVQPFIDTTGAANYDKIVSQRGLNPPLLLLLLPLLLIEAREIASEILAAHRFRRSPRASGFRSSNLARLTLRHNVTLHDMKQR